MAVEVEVEVEVEVVGAVVLVGSVRERRGGEGLGKVY